MTITRGVMPPPTAGKTLSFVAAIEPTDTAIASWFDTLANRYTPTGEVWVRQDELKSWQVWFGLEVKYD